MGGSITGKIHCILAYVKNGYLKFILISGVGWLLDLSSFSVLTLFIGVAPGSANFLSSMIGVTYVWFAAISHVFSKPRYGRSHYLFFYWGYQFVAISIYSLLLSMMVAYGSCYLVGHVKWISIEMLSKIILTLPNLITNFFFMRFLTRFMRT